MAQLRDPFAGALRAFVSASDGDAVPGTYRHHDGGKLCEEVANRGLPHLGVCRHRNPDRYDQHDKPGDHDVPALRTRAIAVLDEPEKTRRGSRNAGPGRDGRSLSPTMPIDDKKLKAFIAKAVNDIGAGMSAALVVIGDKLGPYKAMAGAGPLTPAELAGRTGTVERYVREWLGNQAAGGYVEYDPAAGT